MGYPNISRVSTCFNHPLDGDFAYHSLAPWQVLSLAPLTQRMNADEDMKAKHTNANR